MLKKHVLNDESSAFEHTYTDFQIALEWHKKLLNIESFSINRLINCRVFVTLKYSVNRTLSVSALISHISTANNRAIALNAKN